MLDVNVFFCWFKIVLHVWVCGNERGGFGEEVGPTACGQRGS
jgi:hypothetical protein